MASKSKYSGTMTPLQFKEAVRGSNLSPANLARARRVLVGGESALDVARSDRVTNAVVYGAIYKISSSSPKR